MAKQGVAACLCLPKHRVQTRPRVPIGCQKRTNVLNLDLHSIIFLGLEGLEFALRKI